MLAPTELLVWLSPALTLLGGGIGWLFGSYISKRGEIRAIHKELGRVVEQNKAITSATEESKGAISTEVWRRDLKKDACYELLKQLEPMGRALSNLAAKYTRSSPELIQAAQGEFVRAYGDYLKAQIVVEMVGSESLRQTLRDLTNTIRQAYGEIKAKEFDQAWKALEQFSQFNEAFMNACRRELGFEESAG